MTGGPLLALLLALSLTPTPATEHALRALDGAESPREEVDVMEITEDYPAPERGLKAAAAGGAEQRVVVVSGGISRGSYQAGQLWALLEHLKREARYREAEGLPPTQLTLVGASAGSINAFTAAGAVLMESVWPVDRPVERSPFYRAWVPEGFHGSPQSLDRWPDGVTPEALIRDDFLEESVSGIAQELRRPGHLPAWKGPVRLAMTTTRLVADTGPAGVSRDLNESFGFEVSRSALGTVVVRPLRLTCPGDPAPRPGASERLRCEVDDAVARPMTQADGSALTVSWERAGALIEASSAVPLAFKPYALPCAQYLTWSLWPKEACYVSGDTSDLLMVDGGVLDGHPFRVGDRVSWGDHEGDASRFFFLDPDMDGSRPAPPPAASTAEQTLRFFSQVVPSARAQSVTQFFQDHPHLYTDATVLEARSAPIGNYLGGFLAFYDHSFRTWDFYAGVHDGYVNLREEVEARNGVDCSDHEIGTGRSKEALCAALLPALSELGSPGFHATHRVLSAVESGALDGADWAQVALAVDAAFAPLTPEQLTEAAHVHEMGGALKEYDPLSLLRNLRMLGLLVATRATDAEGLGESYGFEWFSERLSSVMPCPSEAGCVPFWFVPADLGGALPLSGALRVSERVGLRLAAEWAEGGASRQLADAFTLRQDGAFSVLFRRRVNWQLSRIHRHELLGEGPLARAVPRTARVVLTGPNRLLSWSAGTPTVIDAPGAYGVGWDAWRVRPWSAFGKHLRLPWVYGGFHLYGNPLRWWPRGSPNAVLSARAGLVALQLRGGERRAWIFDAPITPAAGPLFPLTVELGAKLQGAWVYGGAAQSLLIRPLWTSARFPAFAATPALEARLMVLGWVAIGGEWHPFTRALSAGAGAEGENPELRIVLSLTRPGAVRRRPYGTEWR